MNAVVTVVCTTLAPFCICTVYEPKGAAAATMKNPVRTPLASMVQAVGFAPVKNRTVAGIEVVSTMQTPAAAT